MPNDEAQGEGVVVSSLLAQQENLQDTNVPSLSDLSNRDAVWDKHRNNADRVSNHYRSDKEFHRYSERIDFCSQVLDFRLVPEQSEGSYKLKLAEAKFCRVRHCPVCQWRRSLMWKARAYEALPGVINDFPKHRWLFLTLTVKNVPIQELRSTLDSMNKSFVRGFYFLLVGLLLVAVAFMRLIFLS